MKSKLFLYLLLLTCQGANAAGPAPPAELNWQDFRGSVYQSDQLVIAGQPLSEAAMRQLAKAGITTIVNLRTAEEMADKNSTPINEAALSQALGMHYVHLPSGGDDHPYAAETVQAFADVMSATDGRVLLHCNSGRRATHLWVAYLVDHQGLALDAAIRLGSGANFGSLPLEGFLKSGIRFEPGVAAEGAN